MARKACSIVLSLLIVVGAFSSALAATQGIITISGTGVPVSGTGGITVAFSDSTGKLYTETVLYGTYSSPASLASGLAAMFTRDYICVAVHNCTSGLGAKASGTAITFQLNNAATFGSPPTINNSSSSFSLVATTWPTQSPLSISTASLPAGVQDIPYNATLQASGGQPPYTWSTTGSLPPGLQLNSDGAITGTPTQTGTTTFTPQVTDSAQATATKSLSVTVNPGAPSLPFRSVGYTYDSQGRVHTATYTTPAGNVTVTYTYDNAGNRTTVVTQ